MGKGTKVVIDNNVFISGFGWNGKPEEILKLLQDDHIVNYITSEIFEELRRVISYPKLNFSESLQIKILEFVLFHSECVEPEERISAVTEDPDDNKFLECSIAAKAEYIISGDPHLIKLKKFRTVEIVDVNEFLNIISKKNP